MPSETQLPEPHMILGRKTQKIFASAAEPNSIAVFGSLANPPTASDPEKKIASTEIEASGGNEMFTDDPDKIQNEAYEKGWSAAVVSDDSPALEDMNALFYLITRQLAYIMQAGVPEWDADTSYRKGNMCSHSGFIYVALDGNANKPVSDETKWVKLGSEIVEQLTAAIRAVNDRIDAAELSSNSVDVVGTHAALLAYDTSAITANDIITVIRDETHSNHISYYRWGKAGNVWGWNFIIDEPPVTKGQIGLGNVDNTSDADKPISKATQQALAGKANQGDMDHAIERLNLLEEQAVVAEITETYAGLQTLSKSKFTANDYVKVLKDEIRGGKASFYQLSADKTAWNWKYSEAPISLPLEGDQVGISNPNTGQLVFCGADGDSFITIDTSVEMIGRAGVDIQSHEGKVTLTTHNSQLIVGEGKISISGDDGNVKLTGVAPGNDLNDAVNKHQLDVVEAKAEDAIESAHTKIEAVFHDVTLSGDGTVGTPLSAAPLLTLVADDATAEAMSLLYPDRYFASPE
ncbi:hypothetical protein [Ereboglobus luteus]|uniref:Uncharacterized protein n=1 Tax=Ereboglobus luteus TaxID=1796921 RepID=A0A2U8E6E1_9BACT|nr:hypothetical protein [Ereboglobus luteus]AWI10325.1 hypothetical protein CKA38_14625 [Ereboglobus luteus]